MRISRFTSERDSWPAPVELDWPGLAQLLATPRVGPCTTATCIGKNCPHKYGPSWSPATYPPGATRSSSSVEAVSVLVLDVDHLRTPEELAATDAALARWRHIAHTTHNDRDGDRAFRVVIPLSRPVLPAEWRAFWFGAVALIGAPVATKDHGGVDTVVKDPGRLYFLPSCVADRPYIASACDGEILDVDAAIAAAPLEAPRAPSSSTVPDELAGELSDYPPATVELLAYARQRLEEHGPSIRGQGGDAHAFRVGAILLHDLALTPEEAWPLALWWRDRFPENTWSDDKLATKIYNGYRYASGERGEERDRFDTRAALGPVVASLHSEVLQRDPSRIQTAPGAVVTPQGLTVTGGESPLPPRFSEVAARWLMKSPVIEYATGFPALDEAMGGGITTRGLHVVIGGTGAGKSGWVLSVLRTLAGVGVPSLYASTELESMECLARFAAPVLDVAHKDLVRGRVPIGDAVRAVGDLPVHVVGVDEFPLRGSGAAGMRYLADAVKRFSDQYGRAPVLGLDYMQMVAPTGFDTKNADSRMGMTDVAYRLQEISIALDCAVIGVSSTGRANYKPPKDPADRDDPISYLAAAKESGDIEYAATNVLYLDVASKSDGGYHAGRVAVAKARFGERRFIGVRFHGPSGAWAEHAASMNAMSGESQVAAKESAESREAESKILSMVETLEASRELKTATWLRTGCGVPEKRAAAAVKRLIELGKLEERPAYDQYNRIRAGVKVVGIAGRSAAFAVGGVDAPPRDAAIAGFAGMVTSPTKET